LAAAGRRWVVERQRFDLEALGQVAIEGLSRARCDDQVCDQQLPEHIRADVALLNELTGGAARNPQILEGRTNQLFFDTVKINAVFDAKRTDDKRMHGIYLLTK